MTFALATMVEPATASTNAAPAAVRASLRSQLDN
jgi:hypothetical protein